VIVSASDWERLTTPQMPFTAFLLGGGRWSDDVVDTINDRSRDTGRDVDF
jgi:hypothetical protein